VGFDVMNDDFSNDKVIPFPNLPLRLLDKGSNLLIEGRIKEAIPYLEKAEQLEPENPDILYTLIGAYLEQGNFTKAKMLLEEMVHTGVGDYFETVEIYMTVLFQLHEYKKITTMLTMLLDEDQVPLEKIDQYKELLELSRNLANGMDELPTSDVHINLFEDDLKTTIQNLENLDKNGIARHLPEIKEYLESETGNPFLKTILLNVLRENHYEEKVVVKKFNQTVQLNIQTYADVQDAPFPRKVKEKLEVLLVHENPSLFTYAVTLTERFFFMIYPLEMNFSSLDIWVNAILFVVEDYFDQHTDNISNLSEMEMNKEELAKAIDFITEVEQQFWITTQ
jgi:pentatricopeptide repeat protein